MALDADRRAGLERGRAIAIARDAFDLDPEPASIDASPFGVVVDDGGHVVIVSSSEDLAVLGGVLVWVGRNPRPQVDLVVEHHASIHARRASVLAPSLSVHELDGADVKPAVPTAISPPHEPPDDIVSLIAMIERAGAAAVTEDGIVRAEIAGLEIGRVVTGPTGSTLEVGVGRFDREAGALLHADRAPEPTLVATLEQVVQHRHPGAVSHPINRIGRERWLRSIIVDDPMSVGCSRLELTEPVPPRTSLLETRPAALVGVTSEGVSVLVVCTVGVDLGVVPEVADLLAVTGATAVKVAIPERDQLPYLNDLIELLPVPAELVSIETPWS